MFDEVLGQTAAKQQLQNILDSGQYPNGLLLYGPKRVGKYSLAFSFLKAVNCRGQREAKCYCTPCRKLQEGTHPDVVVIKPNDKGHINIDQVRSLTSHLSYCRNEANRKMVLIKSAELMNHQATNALLKTLEEPQGDTTIVLTTSNVDQVFDTIKSRCYLVSCSFLTDADLSNLFGATGDYTLDEVQLALMCGMYRPELVQGDVVHLRFLWDGSETELPDKVEPEVIKKELTFLSAIFAYLLRSRNYQYKFVFVNRANSDRLRTLFDFTEQAIQFLEKGVKPLLVVQWYARRVREAQK